MSNEKESLKSLNSQKHGPQTFRLFGSRCGQECQAVLDWDLKSERAYADGPMAPC